MDIVKENDRFAEDRNIRPRQRSGFECFIIMLLVAFFGLFYDFLGNAGYALKIR